MQAYYSERVGTLPKLKAKRMILEFFSFSQSIIVNYFPVKVCYMVIIMTRGNLFACIFHDMQVVNTEACEHFKSDFFVSL